MKKVLTSIFAAALVAAAASQASAAALETKGEYRGRYWYLSNYSKTNAVDVGKKSTNDFWDQRLRLGMSWQVNETVSVGARADILENVWQTDVADGQEIDFDQAWAKFDIAPVTFSVGKMDVSWGPGMYAKADNRYRIKLTSKFDTMGVGFAWDTFREDFDAKGATDDQGFSAWLTGEAGGYTYGVLGLYRTNGTDPTVKKTIGGVDAFANGQLGPAKLSAEFIYASGSDDYDNLPTVDKTGMMAYVGGFMPAGPVNVGVEFGYASGNDPKTAKNEGALVFDYNGPFNSFILFNNFDLDGWNSVYSGGADTGLNNAIALKASGSFAMSKQLSLIGALVWAQANETIAGQSKDMGFEVDGAVKYAVNEAAGVTLGVGYLSAGDFYGKKTDSPLVATAQFVVNF